MSQNIVYPRYKSYLADGVTPNVGGKLHTYSAGGTAPKLTYSDATLQTQNQNPIVLDANGECTIFPADNLPYRFDETTAGGDSIYSFDNVNYSANGGFNPPTPFTLGDTFYASASATISKLAGNTTTTRKVLQQTGNGSISAAPAWGTLSTTASTIPGRLVRATATGDNEALSNQVLLKASEDLAAYITALAGGTAQITVTGQLAITADLTLPSTVSLRVEKGGSLNISSTKTLTINGQFQAADFQTFVGAGTVAGLGGVINASWFGAVGNNVTDDSTAIQKALTCAGTNSGGATVQLQAKTYYIGVTTQVSIPSNITLQGWQGAPSYDVTLVTTGMTVLRILDAGTVTAPFYGVLVDTLTTNTCVRDIVFTANSITNYVWGMHINGSNCTVKNIVVVDLYGGIRIDNGLTVLGLTYAGMGYKHELQNITIDGYYQCPRAVNSSYSIVANGVTNCTFRNLQVYGVPGVATMDVGLLFQNGKTAYGALNCTVENLKSDHLVQAGLLGSPSNIYGNATSPEGQYINMYFQTHTGVVVSDVTKTVKQGATTIGTLIAYDSSVLPEIWVVNRTGPIPTANTVTNVPTGTGTGTLLLNNPCQEAPAATQHNWSNIACSNASSTLVGHGITLDDCYAVHLTNFNCRGNAQAGVYIGDGANFGSSVSNGTCEYNVQGIVAACTAAMSISNVDINNNTDSGIYFIPIANSMDKNVQYTKVSGCSVYRNGRISTGASVDDCGISGKPKYCIFENNTIFENYSNGIGLSGATYCTFSNNIIVDNGWNGIDASLITEGIRIEGVSLDNLFESNLIACTRTPSTMNYGIVIVANANDNILRNNTILGFTLAAISDGGLRNQDWDNLKDTDASSIGNGTGNSLRTLGAAAYNFTTSGSGASSSLKVFGGSTGDNLDALATLTTLSTAIDKEPVISAVEVRNQQADYSTDAIKVLNLVTLVFKITGYTDAIAGDLRKIVIGQTGGVFTGAAILRSYNNSTRTWICEMLTGTFTAATTVSISSTALTLTGTYVTPVLSDLGKVVSQAVTLATGILVGYDPNTQVWSVAKLNATAFTVSVNNITITTGTGAAAETTVATATSGTGSGVVASIVTVVLSGTYTDAISSDIGKVVTQTGSGATGMLSAYNNTTKTWTMDKINGTAFAAGADPLTIASGTGAATVVSTTAVASGVTQGNINSANGAAFGIKQNGVYVFRAQLSGTAFGVGGKKVVNHYSNTAALDFPNILSGTSADLTIAVLGAVVGDDCIVTPTGLPENGLAWNGTVSANDVVTVRLTNATAGGVNPASRTWRASTWGH